MDFRLMLLLNSVSVFFCIFFAIYFSKKLKIKSKKEIIFLLLNMMLLAITSIADVLTENLESKLLIAKIGFIAYAFIAPSSLCFLMSFIIRKKRKMNYFLIALYIISFCFVLLNWFNPNNLFYSSIDVLQRYGYTIFSPQYGIIFWIQWIYAYVILIGALAWIIVQTIRTNLKKAYLAILATAMLVPSILNMLNIIKITVADYTSTTYWISCFFLYFLHKKEFFSKLPLSHNSVIDNMSIGYILMSADLQILEMNNAAKKLLYLDENYTSVQVEDIISKQWKLNSVMLDIGTLLRSLTLPDNTVRYYRLTANKLDIFGDNQFHYALFLQDETALHTTRKRMHYLERYDEATDLYNRNYFLELLGKEFSRRQEQDLHVLALVCVQITNYHTSCHIYGSEVGDILARDVGETFSNLIRNRDAVCRYSDNEIYIFFRFEKPDSITERIEHILNSALKEFENPVDINGKSIELKLNMGVALAPRHANTSVALINAANIALNDTAKYEKRSYTFYRENSGEDFARLLKLDRDMQDAIKENQFYLLYQPQVDIRTGVVIGVEALIRWKHPELGVVLPLEFIPIAEKNDLIHPIGLWVIKEAVAQQKLWQEMNLNALKVSLNVSIKQLINPEFSNEVIKIVTDADIDPSKLEIELTESIALFPEALAHEHLPKMRDHGIRIAMDDFGMGHSSLAFIKDFEPDTIKIDRMLSNDILTNPSSIAMIRSVRTLCDSLGLDTVIEYIEHEEQLKILKELFCYTVQGYLFSPPLPPESCTEYIKKSASNPKKF